MKKLLCLVLSLLCVIPLLCFSVVAVEGIYAVYELDGVNCERKTGFLVVYDEGDTTATADNGCEVSVGSDNRVISVSSFNSEIPEGGFVLSGSGSFRKKLEALKAGDGVYFDKDAMTVTTVSADYNPYSSTTIGFTGRNTTRQENTLIIYSGKATSGTNTWGYEVVVDKNGVVISVGGNDNAIPEGGYVLSAIGKPYKQDLTDAAKVGMTVFVDDAAKMIKLSYDKESILQNAVMTADTAAASLSQATAAFDLIDYEKANGIVESMQEWATNARSAVETNDMLMMMVCRNKINELKTQFDAVLYEYPAVEERAIWIRPSESSSESTVKSTVKKIYEYGFNSVCIELLFNSTTLMPMPSDSLFSQNPKFNGVDMLKLYIDEFHKYGIEVCAWMSVYRVGHDGSDNQALSVANKKPEWRVLSKEGLNYVPNAYGNGHFLNPTLPEVQEFLLDTYRYILSTYDIDGFQLDYVRYPNAADGQDYGFDEYTVNLFKSTYAIDPVSISKGSPDWTKWCAFRADFVTKLVNDIKALIAEIRPDVYLSCAVAPDYKSAITNMSQDTTAFLTEGIVNTVYPMSYGTTDAVKVYTNNTVTLAENRAFTYMGMKDFDAATLTDQILAVRECKGDGIAFFSYSQYIENDYPGIIEQGIFKKRSISPSYDGKQAVLAQLSYTKQRCTLIKTQKPELSSAIDAFVGNIDALATALEDSTLDECKDGLDKYLKSAETLAIADENAKSALQNDARIIGKIQALNLDSEKTEYNKTHPLPGKYELSETSEDDESTASETSIIPAVELNGFEKSVQVFMIIVITFGIAGLPLYFVLNARKKKIAASFKQGNGTDTEDDSNSDENGTDTDGGDGKAD